MSDGSDQQVPGAVDADVPDADAAAEAPAAVDPDQASPEAAAAMAEGPVEISEEAIVTLIAQRDEYLDQLQRMKAEFANHRRRSAEQAESLRAQAAADLVGKLLPVLDSASAALGQGVEEVRPLSDALVEVLTAQGLEPVDPVGEPFDPERHEAVLFESGEGEQTVVETMRLGYIWNERVLRAAMVKVRG